MSKQVMKGNKKQTITFFYLNKDLYKSLTRRESFELENKQLVNSYYNHM